MLAATFMLVTPVLLYLLGLRRGVKRFFQTFQHGYPAYSPLFIEAVGNVTDKKPEELREKKPKITPFWSTSREKKTFRIDNKAAWNAYWEEVWKRGKIKAKNPNRETRDKYPRISIGYLIKQDPAIRKKVMDDFYKWKELNIEGLEVSKYPHALHAGTHIHLEAQKLNPEVSGLHKGDRYYTVITEDTGEGEFELQMYDVRNGKPLRKWTVPRSKLDDYEARYHPWTEHKRDINIQARVTRRWLLKAARFSRP